MGSDLLGAVKLFHSYANAESETRIHEALLEERRKNYVLSARLFVHIVAATVLFLLKSYINSPLRAHLLSLPVPCLVYLQHFAVASGILQASPRRVRLLALMNYLQFAVMPFVDSLLEVPDSMISVKFVVANRFCLTTVFLDTKLTAVGQFLFLLSSLSSNLLTGGHSHSIGLNLVEEIQLWTANVGLSFILEFLVCSRIRATLDTAEAESLLSSFRRMLRGVCDGELLLDHNLQVEGVLFSFFFFSLSSLSRPLDPINYFHSSFNLKICSCEARRTA